MTKELCNQLTMRRPVNYEQLSYVPGMGPKKIEEFGEEILQIISVILSINSIDNCHH